MTQITEHFYYEPFWNASETAKKHHIDNSPTPAAKANIYKIVETILEPIAVKYGKPIRVNSSYRCPKVNELVGGSKTSQHMTGAAIDMAANGGGGTNAALFNCALDMIKSGEIVVGQLIWEFGTNSNPQWVHISLPYSKRNNIIRAIRVDGKTKYVPYDSSLKLPSGKNISTEKLAEKADSTENNVVVEQPTETTQPTPTSPDVVSESLIANNSSRGSSISITSTRSSLSSKRAVGNNYKKR